MINPNTIFTSESLLTGRTQIDTSLGYNTTDFEVDSNNILNLKNKTSYWSCVGAHFHCNNPDVDDVSIDANGVITNDSGGDQAVFAQVNLPNGAVVTSVVVYGDDVTTNWALTRADVSAGSSDTMATAACNTADTSITNATIDNSEYGYFLQSADWTNGKKLYGAVIAYTTDYD